MNKKFTYLLALALGCCLSVKAQIHSAPPSSTDSVFRRVDQLPQFPGGIKAYYQYLTTSLRYPKAAYDKRLEGRTDVALIIERDGTVTGVKVKNSSGSEDLDAEAVRVISKSPKWVPGVQNGKTIRVAYMLPIVFSLKKP